jgi:NIMA (never in mitosis gene a)-related kinase
MTTKEKEQLVAEVNILKDLKHPNIVQFLERVIDREHCFIYILMEYCEGGDLAAVIKRHKESSYVQHVRRAQVRMQTGSTVDKDEH